MKPDHICRHDGCGERALWQPVVILRNTNLRGETSLRVCDNHKAAAIGFLLNDENRDRLLSMLRDENFESQFNCRNMVRNDLLISFWPIETAKDDAA